MRKLIYIYIYICIRYEGSVLQYHKSGKHFVEFRIVNEKRWLLMKKVYFYIIERPTMSVIESSNCSEFKESTTENEGLAPIEVSKMIFNIIYIILFIIFVILLI